VDPRIAAEIRDVVVGGRLPLPCITVLEHLAQTRQILDASLDPATHALWIVVHSARTSRGQHSPKRAMVLETLRSHCPTDGLLNILELWRAPDDGSSSAAVWYGPGGRRNAATALEVSLTRDREYEREFEVSNYQHVEGMLDEYDPNEPYLRSRTNVILRFPRLDLPTALRAAAAVGTTALTLNPPEDDMVSSLP
jgi:hypothetical protein